MSAKPADLPALESESEPLEREDVRAARFAVVATDMLSRMPPEELHTIAEKVARGAEALAEKLNNLLTTAAPAFELLQAEIEVRIPRERLNAIALQIGRELEVLSEKLSPALATIHRAVELLQAAPEVPGYELHFRNEFGYPELMARLWSYGLLRFGELLQAEIHQGRRVGALVPEIASLQEKSALAISRRALKLRAFCESGDGGPAIANAIAEAGLNPEQIHFDDVAKRASEQDGAACSELRRLCLLLAPFVPDPRGKPISRARATHEMLQQFMRLGDRNAGYTFDPVIGDYVDLATRATRAAFGQDRFCPRRAKLQRQISSPPHPADQARRPRDRGPTDV